MATLRNPLSTSQKNEYLKINLLGGYLRICKIISLPKVANLLKDFAHAMLEINTNVAEVEIVRLFSGLS